MIGILIFWFICAGIVAAAAEGRGRNGAGWFFLAIFISPLLALILVLVIPNLKSSVGPIAIERQRSYAQPPPLPNVSIGGRSDRMVIDRSPKPFEPDGVYAGIPYRVADDGSIHAIMQGSLVRFRDFDRFTGAMGNGLT
jgi:hypothetical protein